MRANEVEPKTPGIKGKVVHNGVCLLNLSVLILCYIIDVECVAFDYCKHIFMQFLLYLYLWLIGMPSLR